MKARATRDLVTSKTDRDRFSHWPLILNNCQSSASHDAGPDKLKFDVEPYFDLDLQGPTEGDVKQLGCGLVADPFSHYPCPFKLFPSDSQKLDPKRLLDLPNGLPQ